MGYFDFMPNFDVERFPIVAYSSSKGIKLVNIATGSWEVLMLSKQTCSFSQPGFFFKNDLNGTSLNLTTGSEVHGDRQRLEWVRMQFRFDFLEALRNVGILPSSLTKDCVGDLDRLISKDHDSFELR